MNYDFMTVLESYILKYIIEPNKIVYFNTIDNCKLICSDSRYRAYNFYTRASALKYQDRIKDQFGLEFQIEKEV